jgi:hypothetical protein
MGRYLSFFSSKKELCSSTIIILLNIKINSHKKNEIKLLLILVDRQTGSLLLEIQYLARFIVGLINRVGGGEVLKGGNKSSKKIYEIQGIINNNASDIRSAIAILVEIYLVLITMAIVHHFVFTRS